MNRSSHRRVGAAALAAATLRRHRRLLPPEQDLRRLRRLRRDRGQGRVRRPPPPPSAGWTRWSPRPRRRARSTSSRCRRTGRTTARSSRRFQAKYGHQGRPAPSPTAAAPTRSPRPSSLKGQSKAPGRLRPRRGGRARQHGMFAPYQVGDLGEVAGDDFKDANGTWVNDYGGFMSIGYDSAKVPAPPPSPTCSSRSTRARWPSTATRPRPARPSRASQMAAIASGGSADDISKGVDFFSAAEGGRQLPAGRPDAGHDRVRPDPGRHRLGLPQRRRRAPSSARRLEDGRARRTPSVGGYYVQAINKDAPHPAAARLWQEFLYSDEGQNLWLKGGARPVRDEAMVKARHDRHRRRTPPCRPTEGTPVVLTQAQTDKAARPTSRSTGPTPLADAPAASAAALGRRRPVGRRAPCWASSPSSPTPPIFLLIPTLVVVVGAFLDGGNRPTLGNVAALAQPPVVSALRQLRRALGRHRGRSAR